VTLPTREFAFHGRIMMRWLPRAVLGLASLVLASCGSSPAELRALFLAGPVVTVTGRPATVELRLQNIGRGSATLPSPVAILQGLRVEKLSDGGPPVSVTPASAAPAPANLPAQWPSGHRETVTLPLAQYFPDLARTGRYRVTWTQAPFSTAQLEVQVVEAYAAIKTNVGEIVIEFHPEDAPKTVLNFIKLAKRGFYNGLLFHRIIPGFMMQGGCPKGDGTGDAGEKIKAEFNGRKHMAGTVSMARSNDPDSAGSQFFICFAPAVQLDGKYTAFAEVVRGMDAVKKVETFGTHPNGRPTERVVMESVTVLESLPDKPQ
jgi:peptidyl-prolyl cis-trans isomerase B (cyclophilin B)